MRMIIITLLMIGTAYAEDIRKAPDKQTKDSGPAVSLTNWQSIHYTPVEVFLISTLPEIFENLKNSQVADKPKKLALF